MRSSHARSAPASRHKARLIAGLTKMRSTSGERAKASSSRRCSGRHIRGSILLPLLLTRSVADILSRSAGARRRACRQAEDAFGGIGRQACEDGLPTRAFLSEGVLGKGRRGQSRRAEKGCRQAKERSAHVLASSLPPVNRLARRLSGNARTGQIFN